MSVPKTRGTTMSRRYRNDLKWFRAKCAKEGAPCWICGQEIDYSVPHRDPITGFFNDDAFELDHLYTRKDYPELAEDRGNYRPSHRGCNNRRGASKTVGGLGTLSRRWSTN